MDNGVAMGYTDKFVQVVAPTAQSFLHSTLQGD